VQGEIRKGDLRELEINSRGQKLGNDELFNILPASVLSLTPTLQDILNFPFIPGY